MGLPRTFVGFSSTDIHYYRMMQAWKQNTRIDFNFCDCQLTSSIFSESEEYIKRQCRDRIGMAGYYIMLIGEDTRYKHKYVRWEAEVAIAKGCTIIGVNLNGERSMDEARTPRVLRDIGAVFVPFSPYIIKYALEDWQMRRENDWHYKPSVFSQLGYPIRVLNRTT